jgi:GT2 family glycosyltransferase
MVCFGTERPAPPLLLPAGTEFTFSPPQDRIRTLYAQCDVWITASRSEGFNLPAMEAMACRTPVVATRTGWPDEVIESGSNGVLVEVDDVAGLARGMERILALGDAEWRAMSQRAHDTACRGSWSESTLKFEQALVHASQRSARGEIAGICAGAQVDVTVVLVSYNTAGLMMEAVTALRQSLAGLTHEIIIVDNASRDDSVALIERECTDCTLIRNEVNVGFGRANNQALEGASGRYVLLLNTDAFVRPDTVAKTVAYMDAHPRSGILGVNLVGRDGALQPSARYFPTPLNIFLNQSGLSRIFRHTRLVDDMSWDQQSVRQCDWVPGCYFLVRKAVIDAVGLFDPRYFLYYEEIDHCYAARKAGWEVVCFPDTTVVHIGGESAKSAGAITAGGSQLEAMQIESEFLYFRKNLGLAALLADVLLTSLADAVNVAKSVLKRKAPIGAEAAWRRAGLLWSLLRRTHLGTRATR